MHSGIVKWFDATKGYGFIKNNTDNNDVFVHITALEKAGLRDLADNQKVSFDIEEGRNGKSSAVNVALAD